MSMSFLTSSVLFEPVLKGWAVLYPQFKLIPFIDASQMAILVLPDRRSLHGGDHHPLVEGCNGRSGFRS